VVAPGAWGMVQPAAHTSRITSAAKRTKYPLIFIVFNIKSAHLCITILIRRSGPQVLDPKGDSRNFFSFFSCHFLVFLIVFRNETGRQLSQSHTAKTTTAKKAGWEKNYFVL
jgi:hypothetical protein